MISPIKTRTAFAMNEELKKAIEACGLTVEQFEKMLKKKPPGDQPDGVLIEP